MKRRMKFGNMIIVLMFIILIVPPIQSSAGEARCPCFNIQMLEGISNAFDVIDCWYPKPPQAAYPSAECSFYNFDNDNDAYFYGSDYKDGPICEFQIYNGGRILESPYITREEARACYELLVEFTDNQ